MAVISNSSIPFGVLTEYQTPDLQHWVSRAHGLDLWLLEFTYEGSAFIIHDSEERVSKPGHLFLYPPRKPQEYGVPSQGVWTHFWAAFSPRPHWKEWLEWPGISTGLGEVTLEGQDFALAQDACVKASKAFQRSGPNRNNYVLHELEKLFLNIFELQGGQSSRDSRILEICDWMGANLDQAPSMADLAQRVHLSPSRFAHLFKEQTAMAPLAYFEVLKMDWACLRLRMSSEPIHGIASYLSYQTPQYFSRAFKKRVGVTPQAYRSDVS